MVMCHMLTEVNNIEELHSMAQILGIRKYFQISNSGIPHYDICLEKKKMALKHGCVEINYKKLKLLIKEYLRK